MTYNALNIGRAVALSRSLGLNRNPLKWNLDQRQKNLRTRAWWGLLINDWWYVCASHLILGYQKSRKQQAKQSHRASLAHGTSPHIHNSEFDVEVPLLHSLVTDAGTVNLDREVLDSVVAGAYCFIALCQLTEILGDILPLIYNTKRGKNYAPLKSLLRLEATLEDWESSLPDWLNPNSGEFRRELPGVLNLYISYLGIRLCMCRVSQLVG